MQKLKESVELTESMESAESAESAKSADPASVKRLQLGSGWLGLGRGLPDRLTRPRTHGTRKTGI